jgi:hypothetical protein
MITEIGNNIALYDLTRPFVWKFNSTTASNLVYVIQKMNTNGVFVDVSGELRQPVEFGSNGDFYINPSEILSDEIQTKIRNKNSSDPLVHFEGYVIFRLAITEEVLSSSNVLSYSSLRADWHYTNTAYGLDAATQHEETFALSQSNFLNDYFITANNSNSRRAKWLTNKPLNNTDMSVDDNEYIYAFLNLKKCKVHISIESESQSLHSFSTAYLLYGLNSVGIGVPNIIDAIGQSTWDTISNTAYRVRYVVKNFFGTEISEVGTYIINKEKCTRERLRLYWKNRKGGIDGYTFNSELTVTTNVKSKLAKSVLGYRRSNREEIMMGQNIVDNTYGSATRTLKTVDIVASERIKVTSRFHTEEQLRWLSEMTTSPLLWIENLQTGQLNSVYSITKKQTTKPKGRGVGQIKLSLVMSNEIMTQR